MELEDYIPEVEDFYKKKHSGRKLQWYHHMSNGTVSFEWMTSLMALKHAKLLPIQISFFFQAFV